MLRSRFHSVILFLLMLVNQQLAIVDKIFHSLWNRLLGRSGFGPVLMEPKLRHFY